MTTRKPSISYRTDFCDELFLLSSKTWVCVTNVQQKSTVLGQCIPILYLYHRQRHRLAQALQKQSRAQTLARHCTKLCQVWPSPSLRDVHYWHNWHIWLCSNHMSCPAQRAAFNDVKLEKTGIDAAGIQGIVQGLVVKPVCFPGNSKIQGCAGLGHLRSMVTGFTVYPHINRFGSPMTKANDA